MYYYTKEELYVLAREILKANGFDSNINIVPINLGFNRTIYNIDNNYILKICLKPKKEKDTVNEINFLENDKNSFHPQILHFDITKQVFPFIYSIEEYVKGKPLFEVWDNLSSDNRIKILKKISLYMKQIHNKNSNHNCINLLENEFNKYINLLENYLSLEKLNYLKELVDIIKYHFVGAKECKIHGDLHFNNIIYDVNSNEIKFIDFESYKDGFIEEEFSTLERMSKNPNSLIKKNLQLPVIDNNYIEVIKYIKSFSNYSSIEYVDRILVYNSLNAIKWIAAYPNKLLNEKRKVLFQESKKLFK